MGMRDVAVLGSTHAALAAAALLAKDGTDVVLVEDEPVPAVGPLPYIWDARTSA